MPSTTNFGWTTPADTDLVKDGASAIRTLGNGIDTTLVDLKGGTTGQVLSKNSNTDMDFTWTSETDPLAIQKTIVDAKGDLISATAADTPARLAVGTNGQYLQADSTAATGLKWATLSAWSPAYPLLSSASLTGATTITISVTSYDSYYVYWTGASSATASANFYLRINGDTASNYYSFGVGYQGTAATYSREEVQSYYYLGRQGGNAADAFAGSAVILGGKTTSLKTIQAVGVATGISTNGSYASSGHYNASAAITSISLVSSAGNFDAGTLYVYGG